MGCVGSRMWTIKSRHWNERRRTHWASSLIEHVVACGSIFYLACQQGKNVSAPEKNSCSLQRTSYFKSIIKGINPRALWVGKSNSSIAPLRSVEALYTSVVISCEGRWFGEDLHEYTWTISPFEIRSSPPTTLCHLYFVLVTIPGNRHGRAR